MLTEESGLNRNGEITNNDFINELLNDELEKDFDNLDNLYKEGSTINIVTPIFKNTNIPSVEYDREAQHIHYMAKQDLKNVRKSYQQSQKNRIADGNRICANMRIKRGQIPSQKDVDVSKYLDEFKGDYARITDAYLNKRINPMKFKGQGVICSYGEYCLAKAYQYKLENEKILAKGLRFELEKFPIWNEYLVKIKGVGPIHAATVVAYLDIFKAPTPSKFISYAGYGCLQVGEDENGVPIKEGVCRRAHHLVDKEYVSKSGKIEIKKSIRFNPQVKTTLHLLAIGLLKIAPRKAKEGAEHETFKSGQVGFFKVVYDNYKSRLVNIPKYKLGLQKYAEEKAKKLAKAKKKDLIKQEVDLMELSFEERQALEEKRHHQEKLKGIMSPSHIHAMCLRYVIKQFLVELWLAWRLLENLPIVEPYYIAKLGMAPHHFSHTINSIADIDVIKYQNTIV